MHWALGDSGLAEKQLPANIDHYFSELDGTNKESSGWTQVCALKAIYIKGASLAKSGSYGDALGVFESAIPIISRTAPQLNNAAELRKWTELLLTKFCFLSSHAIKNNTSPWLESETLTAFRAWADFWERQAASSTTALGGHVSEADFSRRQVWREYYATLSYILQNDLPYPTTALATAYNDHALRLNQRGELTRVEGRYEALLLKEVQFPKAEEGSEEVEEWVDHVMKNWRVFCGGSWEEQNLGSGGRDAMSRGVLEILYRAATKTFHSTQILRHLFTVHLAVADFDLAFKAFDTYFDIVNKGKQRVDKTGEPERGLDSNEEVLMAASKCMRALCRFGGLAGAERAKRLAHFFESWLEKHGPSHSHRDVVNGTSNQKLIENGHAEDNTVSPHVYAHAWRSIGISNAQWARVTYDEKSRPEFQLKAVTNLRKALRPEYGCVEDVDTLFALALVLAERRQLGEALRTVGAALASQHNADNNHPYHSDSYSGDFARERSLIPLWHLLALLLSAKEEFPEASRACEGAFKQFGDLKILFGETEGNGTYQSEHLNGIHEKRAPKAVIDDMDDFEKEAILEVKITQLVLIEVQDGPDVAVNGTEELLSLYSRLFAESQAAISSPKTPQQQSPGTATSTLRSVTGSIFGRSRRSARQAPGALTAESSPTEKSSVASRPQTSQTTPSTTGAPTIHVTGENGEASKLSRRSQHGSFKKKATSIHGDNLTRKKSQVSIRNRSASAQKASQNRVPEGQEDLAKRASSSHNTPGPRFPPAQARRHRVGILVKVWLLIAGFYRRAEQYEDAKAATDAACELVEGLEADVLHDPASSIAIDNAGWGIGKCVGELWADVWAEVSLSSFFLASLPHFPHFPFMRNRDDETNPNPSAATSPSRTRRPTSPSPSSRPRSPTSQTTPPPSSPSPPSSSTSTPSPSCPLPLSPSSSSPLHPPLPHALPFPTSPPLPGL